MKRIAKIFLTVFVLTIFTLNLSFIQGAQDGALYLDSTKFKPALDLIKDDSNFSIMIGIVDEKEYSLTVKNKVADEETKFLIMQSANADFEDYCLNSLGIDLRAMLGVKLSEKKVKGKKWGEPTNKKSSNILNLGSSSSDNSGDNKNKCNFTLKEPEVGCIYGSAESCYRDGTVYYKTICSRCERGYTLKDGKCVADKCEFTLKEPEVGCLYEAGEWCYKDGVDYYKTPCSACNVGYTMKNGKCVANICAEEYWLNESYTSHYEGTIRQIMHGEAEYVIDMMPNCQQMKGCERPFKNDNARFGGVKYDLYGEGVYYACTKCNPGYDLIKGHCIAKSGVGSIYKRNGKPIGVVFYEDDSVIKVVSFYNVDADSKEIPIAATDYFYSDSVNPVLSSDDRFELYEKLANAGVTRDSVRVNWNDGKNSADIKALKKIKSKEDAKKDMDGFSNTAKILAEQPNFQAAKACHNYEPEACKGDAVCGKGKWYLPALGELWQLCLNYKEAGPVLQALNLFDVESSDIGPLSSTMNGDSVMVEGITKGHSVWDLDIEFGCSDAWIRDSGGYITPAPQTVVREREKGVRPVLMIRK